MYILFFEIFAGFFSIFFSIVAFRYVAREKNLLSLEKKRVALLADSFSGLTEITGTQSALTYVAESLARFGFPKVLILDIEKTAMTLKKGVLLGFNKKTIENDISVPLDKGAKGVIASAFIDQKFKVYHKNDKVKLGEIPDIADDLVDSDIMIAPIMSRKGNKCWENTNCKKTNCPAYEDKDPRCWKKPATECSSHNNKYCDERDIFKNPSTKLKACLDCEVFHCLGVIMVIGEKHKEFSEEETILFKTFAYETGSILEKGYLLEDLEQREDELQKKVYEISILKELGERVSYSLNVEKIVDIIISSLSNIIDYSVVSYMILKPNSISFKCHLEEPLSRYFVDEIKERMLSSLSVLMNKKFVKNEIDELLSGSVLDNSVKLPVNSFFNIPLVVDNKTVGLLTVASTKKGLYKGDDISILYRMTAQASDAVSRLESVLAVEKGKLNDMVVSMSDGVIMIDNENRVIAVNPMAKKMIDIKEEEPSIFDILKAFEGKIDIRDRIEEVQRKRKTIIVDGFEFDDMILKIFISPVKSKHKVAELKDAFLGTVILMHDVTKEKEVERMKSEFVSVASHQLRTPLSAIKWFMEMLINEDAGPLNMEQISYLTQAYETNENMIDLVNSLLNISRIESGRLAIEPEEIDVVTFCESIYNEIKTVASEKKQKVDIIKPKIKLKKILTDARLFRQVIQNLLSNAVKYTPEKGKIVFTISKNDEGFVQFDVKDNGLGIPLSQQDKIFQKFFRADNVMQTEVEGTGLGLYVCKSIIEMLGGKIWFDSEENKGATFSCTLPLSGSKSKKGERSLITSDIKKEFAQK